MMERIDRYMRHRPMLSETGMDRLRSARVLLAGIGGLGSNVAMLLARLGAGTLVIRDPGVLDAPDLNRQVLYSPVDLGRAKVEVAVERLREINPEVTLDAKPEYITAESRFPAVDICIDCLDSFAARAALEAALRTGPDGILGDLPLPLIHGGAEGWFGQVSSLAPGGGGYRAVFGPAFDQRVAEPVVYKPIMPHVVAMVAASQVGEFVRWCEKGTDGMLIDRILIIDGMSHQHEIIKISR